MDNTKDTEAAVLALKKSLNRDLATALDVCVRCGICSDTCHYYSADPRLGHVPAYRAELLRRLYRSISNPLARRFPRLFGATPVTPESLDALAETAFTSCTLCRRCMVNCPMGVDTALIMRAARSVSTASGRAPEMLVQLADAAISREENLELFRDLMLEQVSELEKGLREAVADPRASIPVDKQGADILYVGLSGAHTIVPPAVLFHTVRANWTLSLFEASNYGVFLGDSARAKRIAERILHEAQRLGVKEVVVGECGHAYSTLRWEAPKWFGGPLPFRVRSIIELMAEWVSSGAIKLDPDANPEPITYHDSCNLARNGGLLEEPRVVLRAAARDFREMRPNRENAYCCGGGSGLVALPEKMELRLKAGAPKSHQVRETGAAVVVASCDNCRIQLGDLSEHYGLGVEVKGMAEVVVRALVPSRSPALV
ncbi:MAG: (Fe-S)-binding protein [Chloroflexota bacterium]